MNSVTLKSLTEKQRQFLETLQLSDKFPEKISLSDVMTLRDESEEAVAQSISDVPMLMLKSVVMNNYQLFGSLLSNLASSAAPTNEDEDDDWSDSNTECTHSMALLQHQDVFLACYLCCDAPLKQVLAEKLFDCKLAVPLSWFGGYVSQLFTLPLRTGELKYRGQDKVSKQKCINSDSFSVLSVIRLGNNAVSKSQLINRCVHDKQMVFRESSTSLGERIFSDGSIEQTWMLPSLNDADLKLNEPVCVLNLRGDAVKCQQQMRFLADVSTCIIVSLSDDADKQGEIGDFLKKVFHHNQDIILVISSTKVPDFLRQLRSHFGDTFKEKVRIVKEADRKTSSELLTDVKKRLHIKMIESKKSMTLTNLGEIAENSYNMLVDERQPAVQQVISNAKELVDTAVRFDATDRKKTLLPLHGQPWHEISKLQKDRVRDAQKLTGNERVKQEENDNLKIKELRRQQIEFLKKGNSRDFILRFIKLFKEASDNGQISIFLRSLKLFLDGENTRIQKSNSVAPADLQASVLGVEHIFRELSQLYEATLNNERVAEQLWIPTGLSCHTELLDLAVQLIVQGHPFELIDGDASAITIKWIEGVLKKLQEKFKKESLLIVSVLGIQSSGKSTLLNTMFGLQLPVSAGRCTRGAFLQMVRNDRTKSGLNADFIMIIDTEGLRSTELGNDGKHRDNELATMAVGLADVTIINIMGENIHEMTNVLQIVVYAFLRISNASPNLIKGKACLFVHQNVCAVDSREKMQEARDRLLRTLDSTVEGAANEEGVTNLKRFADLLKFDVNENVIFLTNLWEGEPPLAPVNPGYSRGVQGTKYKIVQCLKGMYSSKLTFKEFYVRAADFWKAVVKEDFVFSFQNTLELSAYKEVNKKYSELRRDLEKKAWEQVKETAAPNLRSCQDAQSLRERLKTEIAETNKFIKENQSEKQKEIESFFKKHEESQTIVQWQQRTFNNFEEDVKSLTRECNERLTEVKEERRVLLQSRGEADQLKQEFMDKARQVAEKMVAENRSQITDDELRKEFDTMWEKQMKEVPMKPMQTALRV
ncbi:hypothetical protein BOX15_Mlig020665g1 [Macrostomum lignano]|uniref:VLIG-type G domain-containing protein n=1 Tax=Macrostomum lignano TaxID=282301 RepID=A0A267GVL1_9PLAT|nr:hypothetical protein BOX15_Mlig020665g1 [Macrostomum lignano]